MDFDEKRLHWASVVGDCKCGIIPEENGLYPGSNRGGDLFLIFYEKLKPRTFMFLLAFWCTVVYADLMEHLERLHIFKPLKSHYSISTNHRTTDQSKCRRYEFPLDQKINGLGLSLCSGIVIQRCMQASPTLQMARLS